MKNLRLKNNFETNRKTIEDLLARVVFKPTEDTKKMVPEIILKRLEASLKCFKLIMINKIKDKGSRIQVFNTPFSRNYIKRVDESFVDIATAGMIMNAKTYEGIKCIVPNEYLVDAKDIIDATEMLEGVDIVKRKSIIISSSTLVAKNQFGTTSAIPHIQIATWDGYLNSPNNYIVYLEKLVDKYRLIYLQKIPVDIDEFKYSVYEFDLRSSLLRIGEYDSITVETDILKVVSSQLPKLMTREVLESKLYNQHNLVKKEENQIKEILIPNGEKKTDKSDRHIISKRRGKKN